MGLSSSRGKGEGVRSILSRWLWGVWSADLGCQQEFHIKRWVFACAYCLGQSSTYGEYPRQMFGESTSQPTPAKVAVGHARQTSYSWARSRPIKQPPLTPWHKAWLSLYFPTTGLINLILVGPAYQKFRLSCWGELRCVIVVHTVRSVFLPLRRWGSKLLFLCSGVPNIHVRHVVDPGRGE